MKFLIIAARKMHTGLLEKYRKDNPFCDVKLVSKEKLLGEFLGSVNEKAIPFLMKRYNLSYENVKSIIPFIRYGDDKNPLLDEYKKELIKNHLFSKNEYLKQFFLNKKILIYGYSYRDQELLNLLNHFDLQYEFIFNKEKNNDLKDVSHYETAVDETFYSLNKIASLLDKGVSIDDIYVYTVNNTYLYYLEKFSTDFGFNISVDKSFPLYECSLTNVFFKEFITSKNIDSALEKVSDCKDQDLLNAFIEVIKKCTDDSLSFEEQFDYFVGELKNTRFTDKKYKNVVKLIDSSIFIKDAHIFILGFSQGDFPKIKKDNSYLNDKQKEQLGINTSLMESQYNEDVLLDFLYSNNHFYLSYSDRSPSDTFFPSPFVDKLNLPKVVETFPDVIYSMDMRDFYYTKYLDLYTYYSEISSTYLGLGKISNIPYNKYDNQFDGVDYYNQNTKLTYSYSQINTYYQCPFQYYLSKVLKLDPFEGSFFTKLGNLAHYLFEHQFDGDFDFDEAFDNYVKNEQFEIKEYPILENIKPRLKEAVMVSINHASHMKNPKFIAEKEIKIKLSPCSYLVGKIDKTIILDNQYLAIVDYKTGNDSFNSKYIEYGHSLQLPTYCLLVSEDKDLSEYEIMGVFINNVIDNSISINLKDEDKFNPYLKLNGKVIIDKGIISYLDASILEGKSVFIRGVSLNKEGELKSSVNLASSNEIKDYISIAKNKYLEADKRIRENDFPINPLYISENDNACTYCTYKDICFVKKNQRRLISDEKEEENDGE